MMRQTPEKFHNSTKLFALTWRTCHFCSNDYKFEFMIKHEKETYAGGEFMYGCGNCTAGLSREYFHRLVQYEYDKEAHARAAARPPSGR